jgi:hypothetical protein
MLRIFNFVAIKQGTYNVFHQRVGHISAWVSFCQDPLLPYQRDMPQQQDMQSSNQEGRINFALSAYYNH